MVEISKQLFEQFCSNLPCRDLVHPYHQSCWISSLTTYKQSFIGSAKFYLVVHLIQHLARGKRVLKIEELKMAGENFVRSTFFGALVASSAGNLGCIFRWVLGNKFRYYTYVFIPSTINGLFIYLEPPSRRGLIVNLFCNLVIEYWIRTAERAGYISITKAKQTLVFMIGSAVLFYLIRLEGDKKKRTPVLWIYTPERVRRKADDSKSICSHDGRCWKYILKGSSFYFGIGLAFTLAKNLLPKLKSPLRAIKSIRTNHFDMALFFGSYVAFYRAVVCYLCNKKGYDSALFALPAGAIAGVSFLFKPSLGFAIASLTIAFKMYSTILYDKKILPENIPLPELLFCLCQGTLVHSRFMHADVCPNYMFKLMDTISNGCVEVIYGNMLEAIKRGL